ncbi:MAG: ATP-binding protein [candidate division NC10 bacterium]|nr:ATP-binding protein [candidate division NC10 bacterium]
MSATVHHYLDAVNAAAAALASSLDVVAGLAGALEALLAGTEAAAGALWCLDGGARDLTLRAARGFSAVGPPTRLTWEESLAAAAADRQGLLRVSDLVRLPDLRGEAARRAGYRSAACVLLRSRGTVLGSVEIYDPAPDRFGDADLQCLLAVGHLLTLALENAGLREARAAWESTFHSITDGITIQDRQGRVVRVNRALAEAAGMPPEALTGQPCARVVHGLAEGGEGCPHAWALETGEPFVEEVSHPVLGGEFRISTFPLWDAAGRLQGSIHLCRNITKERDLQQRLSQAAKQATVGELAAGVAHEVLNPLNIISGRVQLLLGRPDLDPAVARSLQVVTAQVARLSRIAENLLTFARERPPRRVRTAVNELVEEAVQAYEPVLTQAGLRVERRYAGGLPEVSLDWDQMVQVLTNLLSNARDAAPAGGAVTVTTGLEGEAEKRWVTIAVADTGAGIPEAQRARLFTPFSTTKEEGEGAGLGLSVSSGLVRGHGGTITVESEVGRGTTFTVVLPVEA